MAEENVLAPTQTDDQLVPVKARLPIGKSNLLMDLQKMQKNPSFRILMDILQNINFFSAFTASANFTLNANLLCSALGITPKDFSYPFVAPPAGDLSPVHIAIDDYPLGNLKFVSKGGVDEVFGMAIPRDMITDAIPNSEYYKKYLEMAARKPRQPTTKTGEEVGKKKKAPEADKSKQPTPAKQTKPVKEKTSKPTPSKKIRKGRVMKVRKEKRSDHLVDEENKESQPATEPRVEDDEFNLQRGIQMSLESLHEQEVKGKGKGIVLDEQVAQSFLDLQNPKMKSITDQYIFQRRTPVTQDAQLEVDTSANVVHDYSSLANFTNDAENVADMEQLNSEVDTEILNVDEVQGEEVSHIVALEERTVKLDEGQARSDPGKTPESRPLLEEDKAGSDLGQSHVAQAGLNPEPMHDDFICNTPKLGRSEIRVRGVLLQDQQHKIYKNDI
ncbi:hypothetical protein Tco_0282328, partial [Tanacetum coccineum]